MKNLLTDNDVIDRVFHHIDNQTTDLGDETWREPIENYSSATRLAAEIRMFHYLPQIVCPVAALPKIGSYVARQVAGVPIVAVRGGGRDCPRLSQCLPPSRPETGGGNRLHQGLRLPLSRLDVSSGRPPAPCAP